jgi:hypothetical protein
MANKKCFFLFILLAAMVSSVSCSKEQEQKVDQQYLNSQDYSAFKKSTDAELKSNSDSQNLADDLVKISDCGYSPNLESPFSLDWEVLEELTANKEAELCSVEREGQRLTLAGVQSFGTQTVRWFLLENQSAYRDAEVITATFSGKELRSFDTVGIYEQIPARSIHTDISVNSKGSVIFIRSETIRDIKYPLEQKNTITTEYEIDAEGGINEL